MKKRAVAVLLLLGLLAGCGPLHHPSDTHVDTSNSDSAYEKATLYLPNSTADQLIEKEVQIEKNEEPMVELVQALVTEGALPPETEVEKWSAEDQENPKVMLDLNEKFAEGILNNGTAGETMMMASLVNTIWAYFEPGSLVLRVGGKPIETGHNIYEEPFTEPMALGNPS